MWALCRGVHGTVCFDFENKSHHNREIKMHTVRFSSVDFSKSSKPNQINATWIGSVGAVYSLRTYL
jgi:hypothetical protein